MVVVLDSFEDQDLSEYTGGTDRWSFESSTVYDGSYSIKSGDSDFTSDIIFRTDKTIKPGQTPFGAYCYSEYITGSLGGAFYSYPSFLWAVSGTSTSDVSGYLVTVSGNQKVYVYRLDNGTETQLSSTSLSVANRWLEARVKTWDANGNIDVEVYDGGSKVASVGVTDSTYGEGGFGWANAYRSGSNPSSRAFVDYAFKTNPLVAPSNVRIADSSTEDELTVAWDEVSAANGYYVYRAQSSGSTKSDYTQVANIGSGSTTSYTDTGLEDGEQYYYRVSSHD